MSTPTRDTIEALIRILAEAEGVDPESCIRQCQQESSFHIDAINHTSGALGLFQLEPPTARFLNVDPKNWWENVLGGIKYDAQLLRQFGSLDKALAAYNWGPGHLRDLIAQHPLDWKDHLPPETQHYLEVILPPAPVS